MTAEDRYLTTRDVAERYHTSPETIRYWRTNQYGPRGVKIGRRVLYKLVDVLAWEKTREQASDQTRASASASASA